MLGTVPEHHLSTREEQNTLSNSAAKADPEQSAGAMPEKTDDVPPDGGYGWVCTACNFFINAHTWGINSVSTLLQRCANLLLNGTAVVRCLPLPLSHS
jgi:hypothetical protein